MCGHSSSPGQETMATILIVDDEPIVREVVEQYLKQDGFAVDAAADGLEAMRRFQAARPDLVLLDLMLPGLDGLEVCRQMRALSNVPIIMLTAKTDEIDTIIGLSVGADDYIAKPFSPREVVARVKAVLRRAVNPANRLRWQRPAAVRYPDDPARSPPGRGFRDVRSN